MQKKHKARIGIDLMGADRSPEYIYKAVTSLKSDSTFVFFGTKDHSASGHEFVCSDDVVTMQDRPSDALRQKSNSSLFTAIRALHGGKIDALLSLANTGALLAGARSILDHFPGIARPPLACFIPTRSGEVLLLDVGASPDASDELLVQYAKLGAAFSTAVKGILPKVALLNIGEEPIKGTAVHKNAYLLLQDQKSSYFEFVGNKEPYDIFDHTADVFITNGLIGNLFLKTCEAAVQFFAKQETSSKESGAILLGVNNLLVKCHGRASEAAIQHAVSQIEQLLQQDVITKARQFHI